MEITSFEALMMLRLRWAAAELGFLDGGASTGGSHRRRRGVVDDGAEHRRIPLKRRSSLFLHIGILLHLRRIWTWKRRGGGSSRRRTPNCRHSTGEDRWDIGRMNRGEWRMVTNCNNISIGLWKSRPLNDWAGPSYWPIYIIEIKLIKERDGQLGSWAVGQ